MKLIFFICLLAGLFGCKAISSINQRPSLDVKLIGVWSGEYLEEGGTVKKWMQTRNADGTYAIEFSFVEVDGTIKSFAESGRWWVQDGLFYEIALPEKEQPDRYQYSFKAKKCVSFVLAESDGLIEEANGYVFSECLVADPSPASIGGSI
ncbi:hypothetical protein [Nitrosomonas sp.]|uniref:hypothetical protein n=1 Tax=Nitrosomonas sp. TaxID=42353 RepID=UPI002605400A|nr:hypothetical protein [Nitrosomonas sp.]